MGVVCNAGQTEASQTQAAELNEKLGQLQSLNAKLEEDLLAAEHVSKAGNGHHPDGSQPGLGNSLAGDGMLLCHVKHTDPHSHCFNCGICGTLARTHAS